MKPKRGAKPKAGAKKPAETFQKLAPPRIPKPTPKATASDAVEAMRAMIEKGRARQIAESLPDAAMVTAGLADVTAQALQLFVLEKAKKAGDLTAEEAQFLLDVHQGALAGVVKAHDVFANSPFVPLPLDRSADGSRQPMQAATDAPKETALTPALSALKALERPQRQ